MHDSGAAVAEPDDAPLPEAPGGSSSSGGGSLRLPELLDTRLVRVELMRLRMPRQGHRTVGLARARIARTRGSSYGGRMD